MNIRTLPPWIKVFSVGAAVGSLIYVILLAAYLIFGGPSTSIPDGYAQLLLMIIARPWTPLLVLIVMPFAAVDTTGVVSALFDNVLNTPVEYAVNIVIWALVGGLVSLVYTYTRLKFRPIWVILFTLVEVYACVVICSGCCWYISTLPVLSD